MSQPIVEMVGVEKDYHLGKTVVRALRGVDLTITAGEFTTVAGRSGSGKTTLLNLIGCVDLPSGGTVTVAGQQTARLHDNALTDLRLHTIGFIFQTFNLVDVLDVYRNVELPLLLQGTISKTERADRVRDMIQRVGLTPHTKHRPNELSGGQRQRVAIARALITQPKLVLADEPTANLDSDTGYQIIELMKEINESAQTTFLFSTHDPKVIEYAERVIELADGVLVEGA